MRQFLVLLLLVCVGPALCWEGSTGDSGGGGGGGGLSGLTADQLLYATSPSTVGGSVNLTIGPAGQVEVHTGGSTVSLSGAAGSSLLTEPTMAVSGDIVLYQSNSAAPGADGVAIVHTGEVSIGGDGFLELRGTNVYTDGVGAQYMDPIWFHSDHGQWLAKTPGGEMLLHTVGGFRVDSQNGARTTQAPYVNGIGTTNTMFRIDSGDGGGTSFTPIGDMFVQLDDAAGAKAFYVQDNAGARKFEVQSDGTTTVTGTFKVNGSAPVTGSFTSGDVPYATGAGTLTSDGHMTYITGGALFLSGANSELLLNGTGARVTFNAANTQEIAANSGELACRPIGGMIWNSSGTRSVAGPYPNNVYGDAHTIFRIDTGDAIVGGDTVSTPITNFRLQLDDTAGAKALIVQDSAGARKFEVQSSGTTSVTGTLLVNGVAVSSSTTATAVSLTVPARTPPGTIFIQGGRLTYGMTGGVTATIGGELLNTATNSNTATYEVDTANATLTVLSCTIPGGSAVDGRALCAMAACTTNITTAINTVSARAYLDGVLVGTVSSSALATANQTLLIQSNIDFFTNGGVQYARGGTASSGSNTTTTVGRLFFPVNAFTIPNMSANHLFEIILVGSTSNGNTVTVHRGKVWWE